MQNEIHKLLMVGKVVSPHVVSSNVEMWEKGGGHRKDGSSLKEEPSIPVGNRGAQA